MDCPEHPSILFIVLFSIFWNGTCCTSHYTTHISIAYVAVFQSSWDLFFLREETAMKRVQLDLYFCHVILLALACFNSLDVWSCRWSFLHYLLVSKVFEVEPKLIFEPWAYPSKVILIAVGHVDLGFLFMSSVNNIRSTALILFREEGNHGLFYGVSERSVLLRIGFSVSNLPILSTKN